MYYIHIYNHSHRDAKFKLEITQDLSKEIKDEDESKITKPITKDKHFGTFKVKEDDSHLAMFLILLFIFMIFIIALFAYAKK